MPGQHGPAAACGAAGLAAARALRVSQGNHPINIAQSPNLRVSPIRPRLWEFVLYQDAAVIVPQMWLLPAAAAHGRRAGQSRRSRAARAALRGAGRKQGRGRCRARAAAGGGRGLAFRGVLQVLPGCWQRARQHGRYAEAAARCHRRCRRCRQRPLLPASSHCAGPAVAQLPAWLGTRWLGHHRRYLVCHCCCPVQPLMAAVAAAPAAGPAAAVLPALAAARPLRPPLGNAAALSLRLLPFPDRRPPL